MTLSVGRVTSELFDARFYVGGIGISRGSHSAHESMARRLDRQLVGAAVNRP